MRTRKVLFELAMLCLRVRCLCIKLFQSKAKRKKLNDELMGHACRHRDSKMPLWRRWRMRDIHWQLGTSHVPSDRWLIRSPAEYHQKLKAIRKIIDEILDEILAEEKAAKANGNS